MKLGSLFDGIGGFSIVWQRLGGDVVWASEIEKAPILITKRHLPGMIHLGDIRELNGAEIEPVDVITFGSPCQNLSTAGNREGLSGEQSGLFMEAIRIIREMRDATNGVCPQFVTWENVVGAFSSNFGNDFRTVLEEIAEAEVPMPDGGRWAEAGVVELCDRQIAWRVLNSQFWGVPQRRRRIHLVADFGGRRAAEILFEQQSMCRNTPSCGETGETAA